MDEILVVEADRPTLTQRAEELLADGHDVYTADNAASARTKLPDAQALILGQLASPAEGLTLLRALRHGEIPHADTMMPVITIGADRDHELIRHYQAGADIALPSTASPTLLNMTLGALSDRVARTAAGPAALTVGDLRIDRAARTATVAGELVHLTNREFDILTALAERPNQVVALNELYQRVWGFAGMHGRTADSHIQRVRDKLAAAGSAVELQAVRGVGRRLSPGRAAAADPVRPPGHASNRPPGRGRAR
jgi:DNA-binding response OmpR family regulator